MSLTTETPRSHRDTEGLCASVQPPRLCGENSSNPNEIDSLQNFQSIKTEKILIAFKRAPARIGMTIKHR